MKKLMPLVLLMCPVIVSANQNPDLPNPETLTKEYLEQMSKRNIGQTEFVVKKESWRYGPMAEAQARDGAAGANRDIQESDVYKIGNPSKKELFLLNNYRGFQIVSFEDGLQKPKLVSRLPIYNTWGSEMYYLSSQEKVLIINTEWSYSQNDWSTNYNTKIYMVDVSNSRSPEVVTNISIPGYLQESRMVGDVLYTITHNGNSDKKVKITSIKLGDEMETIDEEDINTDDRYVQTMNVVKDNNKYYVISTLSNWNMQGDLVSVHDITSPNGKIQKMMTASARGRIAERSQTFLHKGHLFAVSNYREGMSPARISVEAYPLSNSSGVVTARPNMRISVGDTNGLNASLQDVRVSGDHLYAFWVPANNIDPFELFDISNPQKGIKHLGQLQFDGWVSKAFPISHQGKEYVLGLGWVVPPTSENGRRLPQAKLFEIKENGVYIRHEVVASLTIDEGDIWTSFNDEDKYFEIMSDSPGKFTVLFPVTYMKTWKGGAKVVTADLNTRSLNEGASIQAQQGWLRRVFSNQELRSLHAFSNERLENFDNSRLGVNGIAKTVSVLELARNVLSFHQISDTQGVQIVNTENSVEVRTVSLANSDAEKTEVLGIKTIPGAYAWHKVKNNKLYAITAFYEPRGEDEQYWNRKFHHATLNVMDLSSRELTSTRIDLKVAERSYYYLNIRNVSSDNEELFIVDNQFFRLKGNKLLKIDIAPDCEYFFDNTTGNLSLEGLGKDVLAYNSFSLKVDSDQEGTDKREKYTYSMPFFKVLDFKDGEVSCSRSINVPGKPVLADRDYLVVSEGDNWRGPIMYDMARSKDMFPHYRMSSATAALKLEDKGTRLTDYLKKNLADGVFKDGFVTYDGKEKALELWSLDEDGEFIKKPMYLKYMNQWASLVSIKTFSGRSFLFMQDQKKLDLFEVTGGKKIRQVNIESDYTNSPFSITDVSASSDLRKFYLSMGMYGITEVKVK